MIRLIKKLFSLAVAFALLVSFGYCVVLPRVLPLKYQDSVVKYADAYGLERSLINGVIFCESHFEPSAVSSADAVGLMQITEETAWWVAAQIGCWYLKWLTEKFDGVTETALAGYNAGHGNVQKWLNNEEMSRDGITLDEIPYEETKTYVKKVQLAKQIYQYVYRQ